MQKMQSELKADTRVKQQSIDCREYTNFRSTCPEQKTNLIEKQDLSNMGMGGWVKNKTHDAIM